MKRTLVLTSVLAIVATGAAKADTTDVTFAGKYALSTDPEGTMSGTVATEPTAADYTYNYTTFNGTTTGTSGLVASDVEPDYANFKYINTSGDAVALAEDTEFAAAEDYTKAVAGTRTYVFNEGDPEEYTLEVYTAEAGQNLFAYVGEENPAYGVDINNYTYKGSDGEVYNLSEQPTFTDTRALLSDIGETEGYSIALADGYISSVSATNGNPDVASLDGSQYVLHASNGLRFRLTEDGTGFRRVSDGATVDPAADYTDYLAEFTALQNAFEADNEAIYGVGGIVESTQNQYDLVSADYEKALEFYNGDVTDARNLTSDFESQDKALSFYNQAVAKHNVAETNFNDSHDAYENAVGIYNSSITDTIANGANDAIAISLGSAEEGTIGAALQDKADVDSVYTKTQTDSMLNAKANAEDLNTVTENLATNYSTTAQIEEGITNLIATKEANISEQLGYDVTKNPANADEPNSLTSKLKSHDTSIVAAINTNYDAIAEINNSDVMQSGIDATKVAQIATNTAAIATEKSEREAADNAIRSEFAAADALTLGAAKAYADAGNTLMLNQAKAYTDERVEKLDKDLSAGVASAIALSSVSVSNVNKGELSVGGGYGYFNGQSAAAFGAAMGLSNRWSVNAGAGISGSDVSLRAGTNYKFKLF